MTQTKLLLVLMAVLCIQGCAVADIYNMQGMEGRVVDKATQQPLDGVMVVEVWEAGGGFEGHTVDYLPLQEAETDGAGRYSFAARGAGKVSEGFLTAHSPWLIFFKPGYVFISKSNRYHPDRRFEYNRRSDWDGKTVELEKFEGTLQEQAMELNRFDHMLDDFTGRGGWCIWTGIPRTLGLMWKENNRFAAQHVKIGVSISAPWLMEELRKCPSFYEFFGVFKDATR